MKPIASDSDINEVFKLIHQIISTKIKKSASKDWLVETFVKNCIKIFDCNYKKK